MIHYEKKIETLCVYCGSSTGTNPNHVTITHELGLKIASRNMTLIYGAGGIGLMTELADTVLGSNGKVIGVITKHLVNKEVQHKNLSETILVNSMHQRKQAMFERSDAFVILPGGLGTLDEFFETLTWKQIGLHNKPIVILDSLCYWAPLKELLQHTIKEGFTPITSKSLYYTVQSVDELFEVLEEAS